MNLETVEAALELPSEETIEALLDDESLVFWVDWRQEDDTIAEACETVLNTGELTSGMLESSQSKDYEIYVQFRDRWLLVPLTRTGADRHITICTLNKVLAPDYEIRFCIDSDGSDTAGFLPLAVEQWNDLEKRFGQEKVNKHFYRIATLPNLFTDPLSF